MWDIPDVQNIQRQAWWYFFCNTLWYPKKRNDRNLRLCKPQILRNASPKNYCSVCEGHAASSLLSMDSKIFLYVYALFLAPFVDAGFSYL